ncbi:flippase [Candidatus Uhrbacteria bacterium]|nr:flippase [Candidatus Uhrbacteria bacterium]
MSTQSTIVRQTLIQLVGRTLSVAISIVSLGLMTRLLGPDQFGVYGTAIAYLQLYAILMDFGLTIVTLDLLAKEPPKTQGNLVGAILLLRVLSSVTVIAIALGVLYWIPYPLLTKQAIVASALLFVGYSFQQIFTSVFQYAHRTLPMIIAEVIGRIVTLAAIVWAVISHAGLFAAIGAMVGGTLVTVAMMACTSRKLVPWRLRWDPVLWLKAFRQSYPVAITIAFNLIYFKADTIVLSFFASAAVVGMYVAPYKILETLIALPPLFMGLVLPKLSQAVAAGKNQEFAQWLGWALERIALLVFPMIAGVWALSQPIILLVAGPEFIASAPLLSILIVATGLIFFSNVLGYAVVALGRQYRMIPAYAFCAILSIFLYVKTIPIYGALGAAWTTVFIESLMLLANAVTIFSVQKVIISFRLILNGILASLCMYVVLILVHTIIPTALLITIGIVIYSGILLALGVIKASQLRDLLFFRSPP